MRKRAYGQLDSEMPLPRYFLFAGGALLALLWAANWLLPVPASNTLANSDVNLPAIRIHSELKGPPALVIAADQSGIGSIATAQHIVVSPEVVTPESALDKALAHRDAGSASHVIANRPVDPNEQRTSERQPQNARRVRAAGLARTTAPVRGSPVRAGPDRAFLASGSQFGQTFAQFVPRSAKQSGRGKTSASRRSAAAANSPPPFEQW
jgi:hypothetical protein